MVDSIEQTAIAALQQIRQQACSITQSYYSHVTLNADLQARADIINDPTGKYSDTDKIKAYTEIYQAEYALRCQNIGEDQEQGTQGRAFNFAIKDSLIGKAVIDGEIKVGAITADHISIGPDNAKRESFFNSLSDIQKQLPQFSVYNSAAANSAYVEVTVSPEAIALFRAGGSPSENASLVASYRQQIAVVNAQGAQAERAAEASVGLSSQLQQLADIINDRSGMYTDQAKVDAYIQATNSYRNLGSGHDEASSSDPFHFDQAVPLEAELQFRNFTAAIANSTVVAAVADAGKKYYDFIRTHNTNGNTPFAELYASLTPLERLLPFFRDCGTPVSKLIEATAAQTALAQKDPRLNTQGKSAAMLEAEILFGAPPQKVSAGPSLAGAVNTAAAQTAAPGRLQLTV
jgi:hypothetical protein